MKICYIDTETTGLDAKTCGIIQLAAIMEIDGEVVSEFETKIRPFDGCSISTEALAVSGAKLEDLDGFPQEWEALRAFLEWLGKHVSKFDKSDKAFFSGYNTPFDIEFVRKFFERNGDKYFGSWFWSGSLDVMGFALWHLATKRHLMPNFKLGTVADEVLGKERAAQIMGAEGLHNALGDIRLTREIMKVVAR